MESSSRAARAVKAIDKSSVHKICSGQVIVSLAIAVKELVENSLDAGSTSIDVRLKEFGNDLIEVSDNGSGIQRANFEALTLKHHTSKITNFNDLQQVETFGFRGEALSSLCALSDLCVTTREREAAVGTKLEYDHNGRLLSSTPCPRQPGTTVTLKNIFQPLPVRHKEFVKNIKNEFNKMIQMLYAYCIVCTNVRITCTNQMSNGKKSTPLPVTRITGNVRENLSTVFDAKQVKHLLEFVQADPEDDILSDFGVEKFIGCCNLTISGFISSCDHGEGRNLPDRQFYFVNGRPVDVPKLARVLNDAYRTFNRDRYPFVVLDIKLNRGEIDVNVTPDKRQVFLEHERYILAVLKSSVIKMYEGGSRQLTIQQFEGRKDDRETGKRKLSLDNLKMDFGRKESIGKNLGTSRCKRHQEKMDGFVSVYKKTEIEIESKTPSKSFKKEHFDRNPSGNKRIKRNFEVLDNIINDTSPVNIDESDPKVEKSHSKSRKRTVLTIPFSLDQLKNRSATTKPSIQSTDSLFRAKIIPMDNCSAEVELKKNLDKSTFLQMDVIGQFNLGFIITSSGTDLFIIDQHASDEKYNYEVLRRTTVLESQPLIQHRILQLTSVDENILISNLRVFNNNGFQFHIEENGQAGKRIKLTAVPFSKNITFDHTDVDELIFMLSDSPEGTLCRPSRVNRMFASRACRKSIMIGTALNKSEMTQLIRHMAEADQPWNCPHGRPTIRHLVDLRMLQSRVTL